VFEAAHALAWAAMNPVIRLPLPGPEPSIIGPLMRLAARQHSVLSRRQWLDGGLSERPGGVASHRCAAYLWKFRKFEDQAEG